MKKICEKAATILQFIIGISFSACLFLGGLGFIGFVIAFIAGGDTATEICTWLSKSYYVVLIKVATITTLFTFVLAYLNGSAKWNNPITYWKNRIAQKKSNSASEQNGN